ncbi:MAG: NAD(P)H-dependent oxidoreductase subunit E [Nocardioides sp.]
MSTADGRPDQPTPSCARSRQYPPALGAAADAAPRAVGRGRITPEGIEACAEILDITAAEVSGVATFTMYKRKPVGDYHVGVCTNTLCAVMGGDAIFERLKEAPRGRQRRDGRAARGRPAP